MASHKRGGGGAFHLNVGTNEWDIEDLIWDEEECGTKLVSVPREKLWVPDVYISEFMEMDNSPKTPYVYLYNTGHVYDDQPIRLVSFCRLVIYTFPFDIQNCSLTFGSYLHFGTDIMMIQGSTSEEILKESQDVFETDGEWTLVDISVAPSTLTLDEGSYSQIVYYIILRRRPLLYVVNLLIPSCFLITVDLFSFLLPPDSMDRSSFKMTLILGYSVFLTIMNDLLPVPGETTPLINVFFATTLALMVASLLETVCITNIQYSSRQYSAVPHWIDVLVLRYLAVVVCLPRKKNSNRTTFFSNPYTTEPAQNSSITNISAFHLQCVSGDTPPAKPQPTPLNPELEELRKLSRNLLAIRLQMDKHFAGSNTVPQWQMVGAVIDRLLFGFYVVFVVVSFITIVCIWTLTNSYARMALLK
ncbi:5-hydroxytryptamine receptor 3A-like [Lycodopsis pacificus]